MTRHRRLTITAAAHVRRRHGKKTRTVALSPTRAPYIESLEIDGHAHLQPWTTYCALARGASLAFRLSPRPDRKWGSSASATPPSFGPSHPSPKHSCAP
jgi:putative alpha-1,2-mannosidase